MTPLLLVAIAALATCALLALLLLTLRARLRSERAAHAASRDELAQERLRSDAHAARAQARAADLDQLAYAASHDLRAPLRHIQGYADMIERRYADRLDEKGRDHLAAIKRGGRRLERLLDDLLRLSRADPKPETWTQVDMEALAREVAAAAGRYRETGARIDVESLPSAWGDAALLKAVLAELVQNALASPADRPLVIGIRAQRGKAETNYSVRDNGCGFDPVDKERIFGIFQRLQHSGPDAPTGIGLALCRRVIERHGGRIWADAEVGRGATFSFALPDRSSLTRGSDNLRR